MKQTFAFRSPKHVGEQCPSGTKAMPCVCNMQGSAVLIAQICLRARQNTASGCTRNSHPQLFPCAWYHTV